MAVVVELRAGAAAGAARRAEGLRSVERQLLALLVAPGVPAPATALAGPRHLLRAVAAIQPAGLPEPLVGLDADGDLQCRWSAGEVELVLTVEDRGAGYLWALDGAGAELLYAEWSPSERPEHLWRRASALLDEAAAGATGPA